MDNYKLKIYGDYSSQPSRAVMGLCKINKIPFEFVEIRVGKKEHLTEAYKKICPALIVPSIVETDIRTGEEFKLFESHAILRYLAQSRGLADHWFPKDPAVRGRVNQYLDWHHTYLRQGVGFNIYKRLFSPMIYGTKATEDELQFFQVYLKRSLDLMERWLTQTEYLCSNEISIADLSAACELIQGRFIQIELSKWPHVQKWLDKIIFGIPELKEIH